MSDSALNALLRPAAPSPVAAKSQNAPHAASGERRSDDSFSKALERRMNPAQQGIAHSNRAAERQSAPAPKNDAGRQAQPVRGEQPARQERSVRDEPLRERTDARAAGAAPGGSERRDGKVSASDAAAPPGASSNVDAANPASAPLSDAAASSDGSTAVAAFPAAPLPDGPPASDAAAAASLAALLPNVAARPTAFTAGDADGAALEGELLDGAGSRTGASLLEKLIAEAGGRIASADGAETGIDASPANDEQSSTTACDNGVTTGTPWKVGADPAATDAAAPASRAPVAGATSFPGTPAGPHSGLQPDPQVGLPAAGFAPAHRVEQPLPQLPVSTPAGQPAWAEDVGGRLVWMVGRHESKAEIVLTPPTLGKLEVSIHVGPDQTTAHFVAATSAARDALEQAMPRLREVLQQAGINLGQTDVSTSGEQQAQQHAPGRHGSGRLTTTGVGAIESAGAPSGGSHWVRTASGAVHTFA